MSELSANPERHEATIVTAKRSDGRCLVVHDDLELRLRLGTLVRRAIPTLDADCISSASFDALPPERIATYFALFLIVEFNLRDSAVDPLARLARSREQAPRLPIFVFARGGDERNAARTIKLGANDYWPIHSVKLGELGEALKRLTEPARSSGAAITKAAEPRRPPQIAGYRLVKTIAESAAAVVYLARSDDLAQP